MTCLSLSCLGLYGMNKPIFIVVILSCISMLIFTFSAYIQYPIILLERKKYSLFIETTPPTKKIILYIFNFIAYIFLFPFLNKSLYILLNDSLYSVREAAFNGGGAIASTAFLMIFQNVVSPLFLATIIVTVIDVFDKKANSFAVVISVIDVVLYTLLFAGRFTILSFLIIIIFAAIDTDNIKNSWNLIVKHKKVFFVILLLISSLVFMTSLRSSNSVIKSVYIYLTGPFSYLSYLIEKDIGTDLFLMGKTFSGFIYNNISLFLTFFFNIEYKGSNHAITQLTQYMVPIGGGITYNSLGTMLHDFIADFGLYGCLIDTLLYSIVCNYVEKIRKIKNTYFIRSVYYYFVLSVVFSILTYQFRGPGALFCFIFLYIFCSQKEVIKIRN